MAERLSLKWGSVKGWNNLTENSSSLLEQYFSEGMPYSAMLDRPNDGRRAILCELIDQLDGEIWNDWDGKVMTKDEAKKYVTEYDK